MNNAVIKCTLVSAIFLFLIEGGCLNDTSSDYRSQLKMVPSYLVEHFPADLDDFDKASFVSNLDTSSNCISYKLFLFSSDSSKLSIPKQETIIGEYLATDTNIISIKRETLTYWDPVKKKYYSDSIRGNQIYYPVPYFERKNHLTLNGDRKSIYSDLSPSGLSGEFSIGLYDFKAGMNWTGLKPQEYMPEGWKNGFSKGIAYNQKQNVIIYWFVVW